VLFNNDCIVEVEAASDKPFLLVLAEHGSDRRPVVNNRDRKSALVVPVPRLEDHGRVTRIERPRFEFHHDPPLAVGV